MSFGIHRYRTSKILRCFAYIGRSLLIWIRFNKIPSNYELYNLHIYIRHADGNTQSSLAFLTYPGIHMHAGAEQTETHVETSILLHVLWQPSLPQAEYTSFGLVHVGVAEMYQYVLFFLMIQPEKICKKIILRHSPGDTQMLNAFLTYPGKHMHFWVLQVDMHPATTNLLHVGWHPSSPQGEYTSFTPVHFGLLAIEKNIIANF